jgi:copper chaperone
MTSTRFDVMGMSCAHCKAAVEGSLNGLSGVESANADVEKGVVEVSYDEGHVSTDQLVGAIEGAGYSVAR